MADTGAQGDQSTQEQTDWRRLLATLVIGGLITAICFIFGWWWAGTAFLLLTLFLACFAFGAKLRPLVFTVFAVFAIAWLTGALLDQFLPIEREADPGGGLPWRSSAGSWPGWRCRPCSGFWCSGPAQSG